MTKTLVVSRRDFCGAMAGWLVLVQGTQAPPTHPIAGQEPLPGSGPAGSLADPARAGRPLDPVTAKDNDAAIQAIEKRLSCTCGCGLDIYTCRTTDFACTFSPGYHRQILSLASGGMTADEIIAEFVKEHGESILMSPPKRGFALFGYFGPWVGVTLAGTGLVWLLRRWSRRAQAVAAATAATASPRREPTPSVEDLALVQRELARFES
ncbi:MAG TPA: cytochrome c-type biogenesis protein CcmH [Gemmatimonadales bacterium]|nr:cytochrome c-type biogenesis protein CcmH [Gemmatimonadales bacterium]